MSMKRKTPENAFSFRCPVCGRVRTYVQFNKQVHRFQSRKTRVCDDKIKCGSRFVTVEKLDIEDNGDFAKAFNRGKGRPGSKDRRSFPCPSCGDGAPAIFAMFRNPPRFDMIKRRWVCFKCSTVFSTTEMMDAQERRQGRYPKSRIVPENAAKAVAA